MKNSQSSLYARRRRDTRGQRDKRGKLPPDHDPDHPRCPSSSTSSCPTTYDDNDNRTLSTSSDSYIIPVTTDNNKLEWDGNSATILGTFYEVERFYTRVGLFQVLISDRAVALSNGKLAIEDANTVLFVSGTAAAPPGTFERPCPASVGAW